MHLNDVGRRICALSVGWWATAYVADCENGWRGFAPPYVKRSVAATNALVMPGSVAE